MRNSSWATFFDGVTHHQKFLGRFPPVIRIATPFLPPQVGRGRRQFFKILDCALGLRMMPGTGRKLAIGGRLSIDDEGALAQRAHSLGEGTGLSEPGQIAKEAEFAATEGRLQAFEEDAAKDPRQSMDRQEEVRFAGDPALAGESDAPPGTRQWTCG